LSGGQKVKLVLGAAMWQQPHIVVMDEPTNYLDRDALGALACAVKDFGGGVLLITHNCEFADALKEETWNVPGTGFVEIEGNKWGQGKSAKGAAVDWEGPQEDTVDALGNVVKVKGPRKKLSRKDIKAMQKARAAKLAAGQDLTTDSQWEVRLFSLFSFFFVFFVRRRGVTRRDVYMYVFFFLHSWSKTPCKSECSDD
jgi:elongation factor 3